MERSLPRVPRGDVSLGIFGVRHHGPGSARSVASALRAFQPEIVLIEGPPEADAILGFASDPAMQPPVAILGYVADAPKRGMFYPFATFSPEWQAIAYAAAQKLPVRFIDLPLANVLAISDDDDDDDEDDEDDEDGETAAPRGGHDPIAAIARRAGYADGERWWDRFVERRTDDGEAFEALEALMGAVRAEREPYVDLEEERREAAMRQSIRAARKVHERVAVVCGAWHAPALRRDVSAAADASVLKGLPKTKVAVTWIPWTHGRLARASGYGAGIESPGWYEHLWTIPHDRVVSSWMAKAARTLRASGLDIASAHAIEATRLAQSLAALRETPLPGLDDLTDAIGSVYCFGDPAPLLFLHERLIVGERMGAVPDGVTKIPLLADLAREQKRLRLPAAAEARDHEFDLRKPVDLERSRLLHRLRILGVAWGRLAGASRGTGTFRETWQLRWMPEFAFALVESSVYGNTILDASGAAVRERAATSRDIGELSSLVDVTLLADLGPALEAVLARLRDLAARTHDVIALMDAIPPLANVRRYGDVRGTDGERVAAVLESLIVRVCIGLPAASLALDDAAADAAFERIVAVDAAIRMLDIRGERERWMDALAKLARNDRVHGLVAGRATRLLFDAGGLDAAELRRRIGLGLGTAAEPAQAAAWLDGLLRKSGLLLVHRPELLEAVDAWLATLGAEAFVATLPLVRRTFGTFASPERAAIGARIAETSAAGPRGRVAASDGEIDWERARAVFPVLRVLLGVRESPR